MNKNKLIDAYSDLMAHLYEAMDDTLHSFADAMDIAKAKIKDLSQEELEKVSGFLTRDVEHAAQHLDAKAGHDRTSGESLKEWLKFDIELLENFTFDAFLSLADKTRVELAKLGQLAQVHKYQSGDITSPGTFICDSCGKEIAFKEPSEIPVCPACKATTFVRI